MAAFTDLSGDEQAKRLQLLASNALTDWNLADAELELIKIRENAVYKGTKSSGETYVVRVHRARYHSDAALNSELEWMRALDAAGIQTPAVIPAADGALFKYAEAEGVPEPRQVDVLAWVDGKPLGTVEAGIEGDEARLSEVFGIIGETTAQLHNQAESWQLPDGFVRHAWDVEGLLGEQPVWGRFWENHLLTDDQRVLVQRARDKLRYDLTSFGTSPDRYGLIHADFVPENLIVAEDGIRVIDFDDAGFGWHLFDLATTLFFHLGEPYFDAIAESLIRGYRKHRELSDDHVSMLPIFFAARGTTYLGWAYTRRETDTAKELGPVVVASVLELLESYLEGHSH